MWIVFAAGSAVFAGITAIFTKIGVKRVDSNLATAIRTVVVLFFAWLLVFVTGAFREIDNLKGGTLLFLALSGISTGVSWLCYFRALQLGDVNKITPIDKSSTLLTMLFAFLLLKEKLSVLKVIAMVAIGAGTYMMIARTAEPEKAGKRGWLFYAVLSAVFASLTAILGKIGMDGVDSNLGTAIRTVVVLVMAWLVVFVTGKQSEIKQIDGKSWLFLGMSGLATGLSWLCYYRALQEGPVSIVVPIDKLSIVVTIAFSRFFLGEKLEKRAILGLVAMVAGTLLLTIK